MHVSLRPPGAFGGCFRGAALGLALLPLACLTATASGPRFVTGPPFFPGQQGIAVGWKQQTLLYSTDPADLSPSVSHAQADAIVAAAAGVWSLPLAEISIAQGSPLAEHASASNVYLGPGGVVFPADIASSNSASIPLAILYDSDGSVTDTLLGQGASDPGNCHQASVTESVDQFDPAGFILHAILVVNGRCTGPAPEQQLDLQYHLERAFGRVLGLAWSQTNDNVFTGTPQATYAQEQHWPILHPIDIFCGPYDYQCVAQPFQLRDDDIAALVSVYPNQRGATWPAGKQLSLGNANQTFGHVLFPTGEGMAGVNVLVTRQVTNSRIRDAWFDGSSVSGEMFRRAGVSPFVAGGTDAAGSMGSSDPKQQGAYSIAYVSIVASQYNSQDLILSTEPVNPLYIGPYSLGPYTPGTVAPAGTGPTPPPSNPLGGTGYFAVDMTIPDAPAQCGTGADGTLLAPMQEPPSGWWTGQLCGYGHASYIGADVKPNRSFTLEVTALDAQGLATDSKMMPVLAFFDPSDTTSIPSQGLSAAAFQGLGLGTTTLSGNTGQLTRLRLGIGDQRGEGRPDFNYQARLFYADTILPAQLGQGGGNVTITGTGFRPGNNVQINGVDASVLSWSTTSIVATVPAMVDANASPATPLDVTVSDLGTGATSTLSGAFQYQSAATLPDVLKLLTAQAGNSFAGRPTAVPFSVQVLAPDGVTAVGGEPVTFSSASGNVAFAACGGASTCTLATDSTGSVTSACTPISAGSVTLIATAGGLQQTASFSSLTPAASILVTSSLSSVLTGVSAIFSVRVLAGNGSAISGRLVQFSVAAGSATFSGCFNNVCSISTDAGGNASVKLIPTAPGTVTIAASDGSLAVQSSFQAIDNSDVMQIVIPPIASIFLGQTDYLSIRLFHHDGVTPDVNQTVTFSGSPNVNLLTCGPAQVCAQVTDHDGIAQTLVQPTATGSFTITGSFGAISQSASFTVITSPSLQLRILSAPSGNVPVGTVAAQPFTVQLIQPNGAPLTGVRLTLSGPQNSVRLNICGGGSCLVSVDNQGKVSTTVTPLLPGAITLNAVYLPIIQTTTFTSLGTPASLQVVAQPGIAGATVGRTTTVTLKALAIGGTSPGTGYVAMTLNQGSASIFPCASPCGPPLDGNGLITFSIVPTAPGPVALTALWGGSIPQTLSFYAYASGDVLQLVSGPTGAAFTGVAAPQPFTVQVFQNDGVTPAPGKSVTLSTSIGSVRFAACGTSSCTLTSDARGMVSSVVTPLNAGVTTLTAFDGAANQADTFLAQDRPDLLTLVSAPASGSFTGASASASFTVHALLPDGITPAAGRSVILSVTGGSALLSACGQRLCTVITDASGTASSAVTPLAAGTVNLLAQDGAAELPASFSAVVAPDVLRDVSTLPGTIYVGDSVTFQVQAFAPDGVTPDPGRSLQFTAPAGVASFAGCAGVVCTVSTDTRGIASLTVVPRLAGPLALAVVETATTPTQTLVLTLTSLVHPVGYSVLAAQPALYVAEQVSLLFQPSVQVLQGGLPVPALPVLWSGAAGLTPASASAITDLTGMASITVSAGPLAAGASASLSACVAAVYCASFGATGVPAAAFRLVLESGAAQAVSNGAAYNDLVASVSDGSTHPVAGASVTVYQTVTAAAEPCPDRGRCPAAPILATRVTVVQSGLDGLVRITPITLPGIATETEIAFSTGTSGFLTTVLSALP